MQRLNELSGSVSITLELVQPWYRSSSKGILQDELGPFLTPVLTLWGGGYIARHIWRWVIVPSDLARSFSVNYLSHLARNKSGGTVTHLHTWLQDIHHNRFPLQISLVILWENYENHLFCSPKLQGKYIFWEFATDYYDVGFGLYFEWTVAPSTAISVHVSDSSEDEEEYEGEGDGGRCSTNMPSLLMSCSRNLVHQEKNGIAVYSMWLFFA